MSSKSTQSLGAHRKSRARNAGGDLSRCLHFFHKVVNTNEHGLPQSRPRWYCVGSRRSNLKNSTERDFEFPGLTKCPSIDHFLDNAEAAESYKTSEEVGNTARQNIQSAETKIRDLGYDPKVETFIVDCDAAKPKSRHTWDSSPCLTRSRYQGHWITNQNRRMTKEEMLRLQGMDPTKIKVAVPENELGQQIGNAMSINVIERILVQVLKATNLANTEITDRLENGEAQKEISATKGKVLKAGETSCNQRVPTHCQAKESSKRSRRCVIQTGFEFS